MEKQLEDTRCALRNFQLQRLGESLNIHRVSGKADIVMVCGDQEIPAHKLVLEASSPYFETMFRVEMKEANSGRIVFDTIEPDALKAILDYLYLGEWQKINSIDMAKNVLAAAHLIGLEELFQYCSDFLLSLIKKDCFVNIWEVASIYNKEKMWLPLMEYLFENRCEVILTTEFLSLSPVCISEFIKFSKSKELCLDEVFDGVLKWLCEDLPLREVYVEELFACLGGELLTKRCIESVLKNEGLWKSSKQIGYGLKQLLAANVLSSFAIKQLSPNALGCEKARLIFFSEQLEKAAENTKENNPPKNDFLSCIQHFDLQTMTWKACEVLEVSMEGVGMMLWGQLIYAVGGALGSTLLIHDVVNNSIQYTDKKWNFFENRSGAGVCAFKNYWYGFGGKTSEGLSVTVSYGNIHGGFGVAKDMNYARLSPTVLKALDYIFVIGGNDSKNGLIIEICRTTTAYPAGDSWQSIQIPNVPENLYKHFYILDFSPNTLKGLYFYHERLFRVELNAETSNLNVKSFPMNPPDKCAVNAVYHFPGDDSFIFASTLEEEPRVPNYIWKPETGTWLTLPTQKGKCELLKYGKVTKVMFVTGL